MWCWRFDGSGFGGRGRCGWQCRCNGRLRSVGAVGDVEVVEGGA